MPTVLADAAWPEVGAGSVVLVPVGSIEQHGPHLPLDTDAVIAASVAQQCAGLLSREWADDTVRLAPTVSYGASGEHQAFPGTCSIGTEALRLLVVELVRSLSTWAPRTAFVNGHGGNLGALRAGVSQLRSEGHDAGWVPCVVPDSRGPGDAHAGFTETSLMLHLDPDRVRLEQAAPGNIAALDHLLPDLVRGGVAAVSANGVLGDPSGASAAEGARLLAAMAEHAAAAVLAWRPDDVGRLRTPASAQP